MTDFRPLLTALEQKFSAPAASGRALNENQLLLELEAHQILPLAELLRESFHSELILMVANDRRAGLGCYQVNYLFSSEAEDWFVHAGVRVDPLAARLPSLATFYFPASRFEREIQDMFGILFDQLPDSRPLVRHAFWPAEFHPLLKDAVLPDPFVNTGVAFPFTPVGGEGVYEIPVGPVHAGIIEPGHFRFSVVGETVIDLSIRLSYTHKGTEKLFEGKTPAEGLELAERISGDTTVGHSLAYCQALEALAHTPVPARALYLRVILLEMERLYNHVADFGAIANDTGFAAAHSHCLRIREKLLRLNKQLTGNRLLHGGLLPGGVRRNLPADLDLGAALDAILHDFEEVVEICLSNTLLLNRLEGTGRLTNRTALDHGVLGYVARASGIDLDARRDHPFAAYRYLKFKVPVFEAGDVYCRALARVQEVRESVGLIRQALQQLPGGPISVPLGAVPAFEPAWGLVEGWRGTILHWLMADEQGRLYRVKVRDPSFFNWPALEFAVLKNIVPDFPLCNKSFNQSYSGHDL
jgi:Ni,Fe-hydrogenase III large subunit/Ni,Fe-hydrogenase III component G